MSSFSRGYGAVCALLLAGCSFDTPLQKSWAGTCVGASGALDITLENGEPADGTVDDSLGAYDIYRADITVDDGTDGLREANAQVIHCVDEAGCTITSVGEVAQDYVEVTINYDRELFLLTGDLVDRREYNGNCYWRFLGMEQPSTGTFLLER